MDENLLILASSLAEATAKFTFSTIETRMKIARDKKDSVSQSSAYKEIIDDLLQNKDELVVISKKYKDAYEQITITDEDIEHLHNTLKNAINLLITLSPDLEESRDVIDVLIELLNKDTLKTMQLIGFNYKEAIGKPLTEVCSNKIKTALNGNKKKLTSTSRPKK